MKNDFVKQLSARGIYKGKTKEELQNLAKEELHGVQRIPALLFEDPTIPLHAANCGDYEILGFEPLHDISHHIENVPIELPEHLPKKESSELNAIINFCMGDEETKRAFDYRCAVASTMWYFNEAQIRIGSAVRTCVRYDSRTLSR